MNDRPRPKQSSVPRQAAKRAAPNGKGGGKRPATARELALDVLTRVETEGAYSNLLLNRALQSAALDKQESGLATELVYGVIQRRNTLDAYLQPFVAKGMAKLEPWVRNLLRLSVYQICYLDRIPEHAAVSEAVNIAKRRGHAGISGMVNGVLRNMLRNKEKLVISAQLPTVERIALEHSHPVWMVQQWIERFGEEETIRICAANNKPPQTSIRVNTIRQSRDALLAQLEQEGIAAHPSALSPDGIVVDSGGNMALTPLYASGAYSVQDESSMLVAACVDPQPGMKVLDCCAAPGGKTTHLAEKMNDDGRVVACDVHEHKRSLIDAQAKRLHLSIVETVTADARHLPALLGGQQFDRILLDAPCSGLGVIRRKPDMKWTKQPQDVKEIAAVQRELLDAVSSLLAPGGILVYSTCTMEEEENERTVARFLREHPNFAAEPMPAHLQRNEAQPGTVTILPHEYGSDGFFIARLRRQS